MSKKNVEVEEVTAVEEAKETRETVEAVTEAREPMEEPRTINYDQMYTISDVFVEHLKTTLGSLPYVTAKPFIQFVEAKKDRIAIAEVNELINKLRTLPYKYISPLMANIENKENIHKYFIALPNERK